MNYKYIVYCTTCLVNGKIYIGVHKTKDPEIFDQYIGNGLNVGWVIKNPKTAFQRALKKYGYSKFRRSILYVFDTAEEAYKKESEIVTKDFVKRDDNYNTCLGGIHPGTVYDSLYQYSLQGEFIKEWDSVTEAIQYYGCNSNRFNMAIVDKRSAFNSYWSKEYVEKLNTSSYRKSKHSEIYCYNLTGDLIQIYNSITDVVNDLNLSKSSVNDACSHKRPLKGMYFISDNTDIYNLIKSRKLVYSLTDTSVSKYKNGKLVQTYTSLHQAAKENSLSSFKIKQMILSNSGEWDYGYSYTYVGYKHPTSVKIAQYDLKGNLIKIWDSLNACKKEHPKVKDVLCGSRNHTHGFYFKIIE